MIKRLGPDDLRRMWADPGLSYAAKMHFQRLWKRADLDTLTIGAFIAEVGQRHAAEIRRLNRELRRAGYAYLEHTREDADEDEDDDGNPVPEKWRAHYWLSSIPWPGGGQERPKIPDGQQAIVAAMRDLTERTGRKGCQVREVADQLSPDGHASKSGATTARKQMERMCANGVLRRRGTGRDVHYYPVHRDRRIKTWSLFPLLIRATPGRQEDKL